MSIKLILTCLLTGCLILSGCSGSKMSRDPDTVNIAKKSNIESPSVRLPQFPFPPNASAIVPIERTSLLNPKGITSFSYAADRLQMAFKQAGYVNTGFYECPGGFVLVSTIEQFESNGKPTPAQYRWTTNIVPAAFDLSDILTLLKILFQGRNGKFRVVGFMITNQPFLQGGTSDFDTIKKISEGGLNQLPQEFGKQILTFNHNCFALIYEFEKKEGKTNPEFLRNGSINPEQHLQPLLDALKR